MKNQTASETLTTYTKTMTPAGWWEFQKQDAVVDLIDVETVYRSDQYVEKKYTFLWDASKVKAS